MVRWFGELYGLDPMDAYQLLSQISEVPIANVVDANYSVVVKARKSLLPAGDRVRRTARRPRRARRSSLTVLPERTPAMDLQLTGSRVLVTGGTRGIGRAIVEAFVTRAPPSSSAPGTPRRSRRRRRRWPAAVAACAASSSTSRTARR